MKRFMSGSAVAAMWMLNVAQAMEPPPGSVVPQATRNADPLPLLPPPDLSPLMSMDRGSMEQRMAQARQDKQAAERAFVITFPEVFKGPEQGGVYAANLVLRADGTVFWHSRILIPDETLRGNAEIRAQSLSISGRGGSGSWIRGTSISGGNVLKVDVTLSYTILAADYDEARSELRVIEAVLAKHADLLLPSEGGSLNWLRVFMTEDGRIDREHVETLQTAMPASKPIGPLAFERFADSFRILGLEPEQLGPMGTTQVSKLPDGTPGEPPHVMDRPEMTFKDGVPQVPDISIRHLFEHRGMIVSYAWPRRPGEPAGGPSRRGMETRKPMMDPTIQLAIAERYFPEAFAEQGTAAALRWVLLSARGEVIGTGRADASGVATIGDVPNGELAPGSGAFITSGSTGGKSFTVRLGRNLKTGGSFFSQVENQSGKVDLVFVWLAPDSTSAPATN